MARYTDTLTDYRTLRPLGGAEVYVYQDDLTQEGGDLANLLDDDGLALSNPLTTGTDGTFYFNAPDGFYVLKYVYRGHAIGTAYRVGVGAATIGLPPVGSDGQFLGAGGTPASAAWQNIAWSDITGDPTTNAALVNTISLGGGAGISTVTMATLPTGSGPQLAYVTDGKNLSNGAGTLAYRVGGVWKRVSDESTLASYVAAYTGPVATGTYFPTGAFVAGAGYKAVSCFTPHWATDNITSLQLVFENTIADINGPNGWVEEHTTSLTANNVSCVVEYPVGTYTRIKKAGSNTIPLGIGATVITDAATVTIPKGSKFMVHCYYTEQSSGDCHPAGTYYLGNPSFIVYSTTISDTTGTQSFLGSSYAAAANGWSIGPTAIIGTTTNRTFALIGDSRTLGVQDPVSDTNKGCTGETARAVYNAGFGFLNLGVGNDRADKYILSHTKRLAYAAYCSDVVLGFGANDVYFRTAAQILADTQTIMGYFGSKLKFIYTLPPTGVTSSDSFATVANQTVNASNTVLTAYNGLLRAGVSGTVRTWEIGDVLASSRDSGKWRVDLGLVNGFPSADATHENALGNSTVASSGAITF